MNLKKMSIQGGHLIAEMDDMSKVDLGQVVGAKGDKGDKGDTPTFSIENGHLYADYDNPIQERNSEQS